MWTKDGGITWGEGRMKLTEQWFAMSLSLAMRSFLKVFKESRYFTEPVQKKTKLFCETVLSEDKNHDNDTKLKERVS